VKNKLLLSMLSAAALSVGVLFTDAASYAAAPFHETQVPGFHRTKVGAFEVTSLLDGTTTFEAQWLKAEPATLQPLAAKHLQPADKLAGTVAAFLVNTGKQLILVDTGTGGFWGGKGMGHLTQSLRASGYRPEQVDIVANTAVQVMPERDLAYVSTFTDGVLGTPIVGNGQKALSTLRD
jgi:hypothetical protein